MSKIMGIISGEFSYADIMTFPRCRGAMFFAAADIS